MAAIVCVSLINNNSIPIMVQSETDSKPLNLCKQQPRNKPDDPQRVKQTLKTLIQSRRLAEGKDAITIDFEKRQSDDDLKLTPEELARQKDRKEQNRRAAQKCRQKKRHQLQTLQEEEEELLLKKCQLEAKYQKLNSEKEKLLHTIRSNGFNRLLFTYTTLFLTCNLGIVLGMRFNYH
ncbi:Segmentation protein cap'n'collar [Mizuhopecten yessoensis]|uniref:Segmentation protein cap'n'collar n=1 Tax=Mizuhopecten yessoensis TaxID=6573 RepID=A0A210Q489_MIZYE|nr:Segmentation protein cap'n'collar [Mizuhopecten yessoensis]